MRSARRRPESARPSASERDAAGQGRVPRRRHRAPRLQIGLRYTAAGSDWRNDMFIIPASFATTEGYYTSSHSKPLGFYLVGCPSTWPREKVSSNWPSTDPHVQPVLDRGPGALQLLGRALQTAAACANPSASSSTCSTTMRSTRSSSSASAPPTPNSTPPLDDAVLTATTAISCYLGKTRRTSDRE